MDALALPTGDDRFRVWQGDALALLARLPTESVDALITDAPYSSGGFTRGERTGGVVGKYVNSDSGNRDLAAFAGDNRDQRSFGYWCALWLSECMRVVKPGGPGLLFTDWRQLPVTTDAFQAGGWVWRGLVPWIKPTSRPQRGRFTQSSEFVVWGSNGPMPIDGECHDGAFFPDGDFPGHIVCSAPREREHITQKPLDLMRALVRICPSDGVAALLEGRRFVGLELTEHFATIANARCVEAASGYRPDSAQVGLFG